MSSSYNYPFLGISHNIQTQSLKIIPQMQSCACHFIGLFNYKPELRHARLRMGPPYPLLMREAGPPRMASCCVNSQCRCCNWCLAGRCLYFQWRNLRAPQGLSCSLEIRKSQLYVQWLILLSSLGYTHGAFALWGNSALSDSVPGWTSDPAVVS